MNSVFIISNISKYPQHATLIKLLTNTITQSHHADINKTSPSVLSQQLSLSAPDIIITLDLAGFELKTLTGECLFNTLPAKMLNIIHGDQPEYHNYISKKLSLSMLFYDMTGHDHQLPGKYKNMRYYYPISQVASSLTCDTDCNTSQILSDIWSHFKEEVLL